MIKPFEPDQVKTFRTPKYTGITLSLLSMFVLTAMFAVWNKVSNPPETHHSILVLAEKSLQAPLTEVSEQFKNELNVRIEYTFCNSNLIQNLENNQSFDLIISSGVDFSERGKESSDRSGGLISSFELVSLTSSLEFVSLISSWIEPRPNVDIPVEG